MSRMRAVGTTLAVVLGLLTWGALVRAAEIHDAAKAGEVERIKALLQAHPDLVNAKGEHGLTPLHYAAVEGHKDAVEVLLASQADVNARTEYGSTALYLAAVRGHAEVVALLLAHKAEPDAKNNEGWTALAWTEEHSLKDIAKLLRQYGATVSDPPAIRQWHLDNSGVAAPEVVVCPDDAAWVRIWQRVQHDLPAHLQANQRGVAIFIGQRPTGGYGASVVSAAVAGGSYVVAYKEEVPRGIVTEALTTPCALAIVPGTDSPVKVVKEEVAGSNKAD